MTGTLFSALSCKGSEVIVWHTHGTQTNVTEIKWSKKLEVSVFKVLVSYSLFKHVVPKGSII